MRQRKPAWTWLFAGLFFFAAFAWACEPASLGPEGTLHILDGGVESQKESPLLDGPNETLSETTLPTETTHDEPSEPTQDASIPEPSLHETLQEETRLPEEPVTSEPTETTLPEEATSPELRPEKVVLPEPHSESPPPDPVGGSCQVQGVPGTCLRTTDCKSPNKPVPGYCPGPSDIQCCVPQSTTPSCDPNVQPQPNVGITEPAGLGGCPAGMTRVSTFCIDRWEAFLVEILPSGQTQPWSPYFNPSTKRVRALSAPGAVPQGYISGDQAKRACTEAGKRLCTDQEWLRACQGPSSWTYPYGSTRQAGVCNDARSTHPAVEYFGSSQSWVFSKIQHQCLNQLPKSLEKTGAKTGCITAEGVHDMMGNLHEWTADPTGTFRGGFYVDTYRNGNGCLYRTTAHNTLHWDYSTGFRCCANIP